MHLIPPPSPRDLLPPLLACLPTAFVSQRPPPALLPLLSPILRQRLSLLFSSASAPTAAGGWLSLLSWDNTVAAHLAPKVESLTLEPHPSSGELEIEEPSVVEYRRLDEETLQCRMQMDEYGLVVCYLWVDNDEHGGGGAGWRVADVRTVEDKDDGSAWYPTAESATDAFESGAHNRSTATNGSGNGASSAPAHASAPAPGPAAEGEAEEEDDDDYWASYDRTPGRTPARTPAKRSPAPPSNHAHPLSHSHLSTTMTAADRARTTSELEYFARYAAEVQPALDGHDPDEENPEAGESTLNGDSLVTTAQQDLQHDGADALPPPYTYPHEPKSHDTPQSSSHPSLQQLDTLPAPRPVSPSSSQGSVERLEASAASMTAAEVGVKQFISTEIKSLFRLARGVGIERSEFERLVRREVEVLGLLDGE